MRLSQRFCHRREEQVEVDEIFVAVGVNFVGSAEVECAQNPTNGVTNDVGDKKSNHDRVQIAELVEVEVTKMIISLFAEL